MMTVTQGPIRRLLASVLLAGLALSYATPLLAAACPLAPTTKSGAPVLLQGLDDGACEHTDAAPCVSTLGCVTAAPAMRSLKMVLVVPANLIVLVAPPAPRHGDLYRTGPPTPPPNQL
ncbi:MAG: hypothetical protein ACREMI_15205 [Gemmatimonadales bacterium]